MICASEQSVTIVGDIYDAVKKEFQYRGCYFLKGDELDKVRHTIMINGALNARIVGQSACTIAQMAGVEVPAGTKILIGEVESVDLSEEFAHEKLSPVLAMCTAPRILMRHSSKRRSWWRTAATATPLRCTSILPRRKRL